MSATSAAAFVRRRHLCGGGGAARHYPGLLRWAVSVSRHQLSSVPEIQSSAEDQQKKKPGGVVVPWLMLSSPAEPQSRFLYRLSLDDHQFKLDKVLDLPEIAGNRCIGVSSQGHMLTVPIARCCSPDFVAINPLTRALLPLPPTSTLPDLEIPEWCLRRYKTLPELEEQATTVDDPNHFGLVNGRAILSPSLDTVVLSRRFSRRAFFARLSSSPSSWLPLSLPMFNMDFLFHKGQFFAVDHAGSVALFKEFGSQPLLMPRMDVGGGSLEPSSTHLVETPDGEELFLVQRKSLSDSQRQTFKVFRLHKNDKYRWRLVDNLGGLTFFVGANQSVSVLAADFPGLEPDSIYFTDDFPFDNFPSALGETGFFNMRDKTFQLFQFTDEEIRLNWPPPMWWYGSVTR